jgi:hypothetical protein
MLEVGNGMSEEQDKAHFAMWCLFASPLIAGNDVRTMSNNTRDILTNPLAIAVSQVSPNPELGTTCLRKCSTSPWHLHSHPLYPLLSIVHRIHSHPLYPLLSIVCLSSIGSTLTPSIPYCLSSIGSTLTPSIPYCLSSIGSTLTPSIPYCLSSIGSTRGTGGARPIQIDCCSA